MLSAVNQGDVVVTGAAGVDTWIRIGVNFLVPFCVASFGFLAARRIPTDRTNGPHPPDRPR